MNVLITGGAGFIGSHTCRALLEAGHRVRVLDCLDPQIHGPDAGFPGFLPPAVECIKGDVRILSDCLTALDGIDAVFHLAAKTGVGQSMYEVSDYVDTNVHGTATLVEAIVKSKMPLRRLVLASSRAVYGEGMYRCPSHGLVHPHLRDRGALEHGQFGMPCAVCGIEMEALATPETCAATPLSAYAWSKKHQEDYCRWAVQTFGLPVVILRYFNVYGSQQSLRNPYTGVVSIFYSLIKVGRSVSLYEGGRPLRDFVHVSDVVRANMLALSAPDALAATFNVGSGKADSIREVASALGATLNISPRLEDRGEFRVGDIFACYADLSNSSAGLGYQPEMSLQDGMREFVQWANGEESVDAYDATVSELEQHGLFGRAVRHQGR